MVVAEGCGTINHYKLITALKSVNKDLISDKEIEYTLEVSTVLTCGPIGSRRGAFAPSRHMVCNQR